MHVHTYIHRKSGNVLKIIHCFMIQLFSFFFNILVSSTKCLDKAEVQGCTVNTNSILHSSKIAFCLMNVEKKICWIYAFVSYSALLLKFSFSRKAFSIRLCLSLSRTWWNMLTTQALYCSYIKYVLFITFSEQGSYFISLSESFIFSQHIALDNQMVFISLWHSSASELLGKPLPSFFLHILC